MPENYIIALIVAGTSIVTTLLNIAVNSWLGSRKATNEDVRLGLDALRTGLQAASEMADDLTQKLGAAQAQIVQIERQAYRVLSENNRFRIIHGVDPAHSLDRFEPLGEDRFDQLVQRLSAKYD